MGGRTTQRRSVVPRVEVREFKRKSVKRVQQKEKKRPKIMKTQVFADCADCGKNLSHWGEGGNGSHCPPCTAKIHADDKKRRQALGQHLALFVPVEGPMQRVNLRETSVEQLIGDVPCMLYHSRASLSAARTPGVPVYEARIDDKALLKDLPFNPRASRIVCSLGDFHEDNLDVYGPVCFLGPQGESLFPAELASFEGRAI